MSFVVPTLVLARALVSAAPCEVLVEESAQQEDLLRELEARRLPIERAPSCDGPSAEVHREAGRFVVRLIETDGRESERRVVDHEKTVAALIESWSRDDLAASLLEPATPAIPPPPEREAPAAEAPMKATPTLMEAEAKPKVERQVSIGLAVGAEIAADLDGNPWFGAALIGRPWRSSWAPSFLLRVNHDTLAGTADQTGAARTGFELLALLEPKLKVGTFSLRPALGAGFGLLHSTRVSELACTEDCPRLVEDDFAVTTPGPRLELRIALAHPIGGGFFAELSAGATLSPLAETEALFPTYVSALAPADQAGLALPGEPLVLVRAAVAIGWEGP